MSDALNLAWLVAAIVASVLVVAVALRLSRPLAELIGEGLGATSITPSQTLQLARLVTIGLALIVAQVLLRWPLAQVLGRDGAALQVDAGIAAAALACVLVVLVWVYQTARPMVQAVTLRTIDAAIPTTGQPPLAEPTRTSASTLREPIPAATDAVTVVAPLFAPPVTGEATVLSGHASDVTVRARDDADATALSTRDADATIRAGSDSEATLRVRDA
jgi:hypothetical protein